MHQRSSEKTQQTLHKCRTTPVPEDLAVWLSIVNGVPNPSKPAGEIERAALLCAHIEGEWVARRQGRQAARKQEIRNLRKDLARAGWGSAALDFLFSLSPDSAADPAARLIALTAARDAFYIIAVANEDSTGYLPLPVENAASLCIESGVLSVKLAPFLEVLQGIKVERIRKCPRCNTLFWAGRRDKTGCSKSCLGALRAKRHRENRVYRKAHPNRKSKR